MHSSSILAAGRFRDHVAVGAVRLGFTYLHRALQRGLPWFWIGFCV